MHGACRLNWALAFSIDARVVATIMAFVAIESKVTLFAVQYAMFRSIARPRIKAALTLEMNLPGRLLALTPNSYRP